MGNQAPAQAQANETDQVDQARIWVLGPDGLWIPARSNEQGVLQIETQIDDALESESDDELRSLLFVDDPGGDREQLLGEDLDVDVAGDEVALLTYPARALASIDEDELISRVAGEDGVQVAEEQLDTAAAAADVALLTYPSRALASIDEDELISRVAGEDGVQIAEEALDTAVATGDVAALTYPSRALEAVAEDELRTRAFDSNGDPVDPASEGTAATIAMATGATADNTGNFGSGNDGEETDDTSGTALPSNTVPGGALVRVQAKSGNTDPITVGLTDTPTWELPAGEEIEYQVQNTDQITIVAGTDGDGVNFTHEQTV